MAETEGFSRGLKTCRRHVFAADCRRPFRIPLTEYLAEKTRERENAFSCFFGGLEGDRTLEPHGCEPCALSDWAVIGVFDEAGVILLRIIIIETYKPLPNIK